MTVHFDEDALYLPEDEDDIDAVKVVLKGLSDKLSKSPMVVEVVGEGEEENVFIGFSKAGQDGKSSKKGIEIVRGKETRTGSFVDGIFTGVVRKGDDQDGIYIEDRLHKNFQNEEIFNKVVKDLTEKINAHIEGSADGQKLFEIVVCGSALYNPRKTPPNDLDLSVKVLEKSRFDDIREAIQEAFVKDPLKRTWTEYNMVTLECPLAEGSISVDLLLDSESSEKTSQFASLYTFVYPTVLDLYEEVVEKAKAFDGAAITKNLGSEGKAQGIYGGTGRPVTPGCV